MKIPTRIRIVCRADGEPVAGVLVQVLIKARRKNDFPVLGGPTDKTGTAIVTNEEIHESVDWHTRAFQMDYIGLSDASGHLVVSAKNRGDVQAALGGYEMFHKYLPFPAGYKERLLQAQSVLEAIKPAILSVTVEHDGEDIE